MEKLFSLKGRINRAKYFWYSVFLGFANVCLHLGVRSLTDAGQHSGALSGDMAEIFRLLSCAIFTQGVVLAVRRLHDLNRSGWEWWLLLIPLYNIYLGVLLSFQKGTEGTNLYGEDPLQTENVAVTPAVLNP